MNSLSRIFLAAMLAAALPGAAQISADRTLRIGQNALYFEDYILSIQYFNQSIQAKPYLAQPYLLRAIAKYNLEDYQGAEADASKAIELNPYITDAWEVRGVARQNMGNAAGAVDDYTQALALTPRNRQILFNKAMAQAECGRGPQADSTYSELLRYYPGFDNGYLGRARLRLSANRIDSARQDIAEALRLNPDNAQAYIMRADIAINTGDSVRAAVADLGQAIRLQPKQPDLYINRAYLRYRDDDYQGAMDDFDVALQYDPYNASALFNRAMLLYEVFDFDKALKDLDKVVELDSDNERARYMRADVRARKGQYRGALEDIGWFIDRNPDYPGAWMLQAEYQQKLGRAADSRRSRDRGMALARSRKAAEPVPGAKLTPEQQAVEDEIRKFNSLVAIDHVAQIQEEYNNQNIRGKIQDNTVRLEAAPMIELAYYNQSDELGENTLYIKEIDEINAQRLLKHRLVVTSRERRIDDEAYDRHRLSAAEYSRTIGSGQARSMDYMGRALDYVTLRDYDSALRDADEAVAKLPDYAPAYLLRAQIVMKRGGSADALGVPGNAGRAGQGSPGAVPGPAAMALADIERALQLSPDMAPVWYNKGNLLLQLGDTQGALTAYTRAVSLQPKMAIAYFNRGFVYLRAGQRDAGLADLSRAGELGMPGAYSLMKRLGK